ncbi:hypothetical protein TNCV_878701 [Trichonephila clavipes]|nr:hypothetical protein TNCV_878701 [Trichonephila clavipes]
MENIRAPPTNSVFGPQAQIHSLHQSSFGPPGVASLPQCGGATPWRRVFQTTPKRRRKARVSKLRPWRLGKPWDSVRRSKNEKLYL